MTRATHTTVFYHAQCADGLSAAWCAKQQLGTEGVGYLPMEYGQSVPDVSGQNVFILDFSFPPITMRILEEQARSVTMLDHHISAKEMLSNYVCCNQHTHIHFDMNHSGAMLAWNHFFPGHEPPVWLQHVEDRDLWKWEMPNSKAFLRRFDSLPLTMETLDALHLHTAWEYEAFVREGAVQQELFDRMRASFVEIAQPMEIDGVQGLIVNTSYMLGSDVGSLLAEKSGTFGAYWYQENDSTLKVGLRSKGFDVKSLAVRFGGGGHLQASAFRLPASRITDLVQHRTLHSTLYALSVESAPSGN